MQRSLTELPPNLDYLPHEDLVYLLRLVASERDECYHHLETLHVTVVQQQAALAHHQSHQIHREVFRSPYAAQPQLQHDLHPSTSHQPQQHVPHGNAYGYPQLPPHEALTQTATQAQTPPRTNPPRATGDITTTTDNDKDDSVPPSFQVDAVKKRIAKRSLAQVKKMPHNKAKKPWTELSEAVPNVAAALHLFQGYPPTSDSARMIKWDLKGPHVSEWLGGANRYMHPVKFDGKVIRLGGHKPFVYAWAAYDCLQAKFDKKGGSLALKFRTFMVGSGRPNQGVDTPPSLAL